MVSIETGRLTASGCNVSGNATVFRSGRTGSSGGSDGGVGSAIPGWLLQCISGPAFRGQRIAPRRAPFGGRSLYANSVDERQFFTEKPEQRPARFQCPRCRRTNDYSIRWIRRTRKAQAPPGSDERARAMFGKVKDHLIRVDDDITCKTCGTRFDIPSHRALVFLEELEGLPQDDYDE